MTKKELIRAVQQAASDAGHDLTQKDVDSIIDIIFDQAATGLAADGELKIADFGNFKVSERAARQGTNPRTGDKITIAARKVAKFKPATALKDQVN